ncbi:MAG: sulfite exporter TauE/SafE family protein [Gemmatimonadaceae bacterium]|jgi:uncharacterized membrane protein YfcA|nr:sulfite exporter TauE/SafE family protein [Gemmatimonadaceae bacterium]
MSLSSSIALLEPVAAGGSLPLASLATIAAVSAVGAAINAVAGGGTLLTFPTLVALGVPPVSANATSTVALWPGSLSSMLGYRRELTGARAWAIRFAMPSIAGGIVGALLLMVTSDKRFATIVPWLVLGATGLFAAQKAVVRWLLSRATSAPPARFDVNGHLLPPTTGLLLAQFCVAIYGGYFGAGAGIIMLAALGFMGLTNIHQMNGLKNWGGVCFNGVAALMFVFSGLVIWPIAAAMAAGSILGGYATAGLAQRAPQAVIRGLVTVIGIASSVWLFIRMTQA